MDPLDIFSYSNPKMSLIWKASSGAFKHSSRKDILEVNVNEICDHLRILIGNPNTKVNTRTYFKSSIVMSGSLRINAMQADILLADVKKLLDTMRRERKIMKAFDKDLDCSTRGKKQIQFPEIDIADDDADVNLIGSPRSRMVTTIDFGSLDGGIDWEQRPARAHPEDITLLDQDIAPSPKFMAEMERLRALEENLEGPTFLDWEEIQMEYSPKSEEKAEEIKDEPPIDILVPEESQPPIPRIEIEEAPIEEAIPPPPAGAAAAAASQTTPEPPVQEEPSQIELPDLEENGRGRQQIKRKDSKLIIDKKITLSTEYIKNNISNYESSMRVPKPYFDVIDPLELEDDLFSQKPPHRRNMTDYLVKLFRPCDDEAPLPGPTSPSHAGIEDIVRGASYVEERDLSAIPSLIQDTSTESSQSKSAIHEAPSAIVEEVPITLHTIEEQEGGISSPSLLTKGPESSTKRKLTDRKNGKKSDGSSSSSSSPSRKSLRLSVEKAAGDLELEPLEILPVEVSEVSDSSEEGFTKVDEMKLMVLDYFRHHPQAFFDELLPENPSDRHLSRLFVILLHLCKDFKLDLHQEEVFAPIKITPHALEEECSS